MKERILPIVLEDIKIGHVIIDEKFYDILECNQTDIDLEYLVNKKNGDGLINLKVKVKNNECKTCSTH